MVIIMKIGEVLEKTGLTDRAVRLYIEHGLITPSVEKKYSGRKSFAFSAEDVEKLRKISILRKADFSLLQIGRIDAGGDDAATALSEFMEAKREKYSADGEIIEALDGFAGDVTLESVAVALEMGGADKMVNSDMVPTKAEIREKRVCLATGIFVTVGSSLWLLFLLLVNLGLFIGFYRHTKISLGIVLLQLIVMIPTFIGLWYGIETIKNGRSFLVISKKIPRKSNAIGGMLIIVFIWIISFQFQVVLSGFIPFAYSETTEVDDYLVLDSTVSRWGADNINCIFPACVPKTALDCDYYYNYSNIVESKFEIVAQWKLDSKEFEKEKQRIVDLYPKAETYQKGEYTCVAIKGMKESSWEFFSETVLMFAYDDDTQTVRYIYREDIEHLEPYFVTLDW